MHRNGQRVELRKLKKARRAVPDVTARPGVKPGQMTIPPHIAALADKLKGPHDETVIDS